MSRSDSPDEVTLLTRKIIDVSVRLGVVFALVLFSFQIVLPFAGANGSE